MAVPRRRRSTCSFLEYTFNLGYYIHFPIQIRMRNNILIIFFSLSGMFGFFFLARQFRGLL